MKKNTTGPWFAKNTSEEVQKTDFIGERGSIMVSGGAEEGSPRGNEGGLWPGGNSREEKNPVSKKESSLHTR